MSSLKIEMPIADKKPNKEFRRRRHRPPPIKIERKTSWSETKTPYDPPSPPNKNKTKISYTNFFTKSSPNSSPN